MNDSSQSALCKDRLEHLKSVIESDIGLGKYYGACIAVARHGELGLHAAFGHADKDGKVPVRTDSVFSIFSTTKALTNILALRAIELGQFALTTRVSDVIPEFSGGLRQHINFYHLLTHSSGLPSVWQVQPGMYIDRLDEMVAAVCKHVHATELPGKRVDYAPLVHHVLMAEAVRRTDPKGRGYREIVQQELFTPLGMKDSSIGVRADLKSRHLVPAFITPSPIQHLGHSDLGPNGAFEEEHAEMPWVGAVTTTADLFRFAEMLRRGGELDGHRVLSRVMVERSCRNETGEKPNELYKAVALAQGWEPFPAYIGLGFFLRGTAVCHHLFGSLTSPGTFGNYGFGSSVFWIDPELDMTFVCLTTGVMERVANMERFQRLSDIAVSAAR